MSTPSRRQLFVRRQKEEIRAAAKVAEAHDVSPTVQRRIEAVVHALPKRDLELLADAPNSREGNQAWVAVRSEVWGSMSNNLGRGGEQLEPAIRGQVREELQRRKDLGIPDRDYSGRTVGTATAAVPPPGALVRKAQSTDDGEVHSMAPKRKVFQLFRQPSGKRRDQGPATNFYETAVTKPPQEDLLELAAEAMGKDPNGINRALRDLTGSRTSKTQAGKLSKGIKRGMAEGGYTDLQLAKGLLYLKQNPAELKAYQARVETRRNADALAKEEAELDTRYGRRTPAKPAFMAVAEPTTKIKPAVKPVVHAVAPAAVRAARRHWPGLSATWNALRAPSHVKGAKFLGRLVLKTPSWLPGFLVTIFVLGTANVAWEFYTNAGVTPGTIYALHALLAVVAATANAFIVVFNAAIYAVSVFGNVFLLGLLEIVIQVVNWAISPLTDALQKIGIDAKPLEFKGDAGGPLFQLAYLTPGVNGSCGGEILHFQDCTGLFLSGNEEIDLKFNQPDIDLDALRVATNTGNSARDGLAGLRDGLINGGKALGELAS